jgi:DNA-nicking Smr family endonuclease
MGPADRSGEKKVRRGQSEVHAILDLHGHTQVSATRELSAFLQRERSRGARCVLVITGKGRGGEGVLRRRFVEWLETPSTRHSVSGYAPAHPRHGGEGAFYLFLRRQKDE